jgi:ParB family chromosome partitioning protein
MAEKTNKNRGLGRGLSALLADLPEENKSPDSPQAEQALPIHRIVPNPDQPRRQFDEALLDDLAASIKEKGVIQPLIVRPNGAGDYEIVAGERRWRAAQRAQLHEVPVIVRDLSDLEVLEIAIIENIQRDDLNAIDEAAGYRQLMDRFGHTQEKISAALGKSRSHIANLLRLLSLPPTVQEMVTSGKLTAGHARALVGQEDALAFAQAIIKKGLSVRATEQMVKKGLGTGKTTATKSSSTGRRKDADTVALEQELSAALGMKTEIDHSPNKENGRLIINYRSFDQLDDLMRVLSGG